MDTLTLCGGDLMSYATFIFIFFLVGIIFTLMSLEDNYVFTPKHLIYKDKKQPFLKVIFDILIAWCFAANTTFFLYILYDVFYFYINQGPKFIKICFIILELINSSVMPILLYKRIFLKNKNKG